MRWGGYPQRAVPGGKSPQRSVSVGVQNPQAAAPSGNASLLTEDDFKDELGVLTHEVKKGEKVFYAESSKYDIKKAVSPRLELLSVLKDRYDVILYEADGSRGLPLKIHSERDPVIVEGTTAVIAIMGLGAIGNKAYSVVFGDDSEKSVDSRYLESYLKNPDGLLKGMSTGTENIIVVNQADSYEDKIEEVRKVKFPYPVFIASEERDEIYLSI